MVIDPITNAQDLPAAAAAAVAINQALLDVAVSVILSTAVI
jgi:hypothetical protein